MLQPFLDYLRLEKNYSKHTVLAYQRDVEYFSAFAKAEYNQSALEEINYAQIRAWIVSLVNEGVSNRTVNRKISSLRSYYNFLLTIGVITSSPLIKHTSLKVPKRAQIPFSEIEVKAVFEEFRGVNDFESLRDLVILELLYGTGMRRAELVNLTVGSLDLAKGTLKILGKRNAERIVPLLPSTLATLCKYMDERVLYVGDAQDDPLIVTNKGVKIYSTLVYRVINRYFSKTSNKLKSSPHILRHSFATHLLNQGAELNIVKELLGHASLASTQVYTHNSINTLRDVYSKAHPRNK